MISKAFRIGLVTLALASLLMAFATAAWADVLATSCYAFGTSQGNTIYRYSDSGAYIGRFAGPDGINGPWGIAVGPNGWVFVCNSDDGASRPYPHQMTYFDASGGFLGAFGASELVWPKDVAVAPNGDVFVTGGGNDGVNRLNGLYRYRYNGSTFVKVGSYLTGIGVGNNSPSGITVGPDGTIYWLNNDTTQSGWKPVWYLSPTDGYTTPGILFNAGSVSSLASAELWDLAVGPDGKMYVAAFANPSGEIHRFANIGETWTDDGVFLSPIAMVGVLAFGPSGDLYYAWLDGTHDNYNRISRCTTGGSNVATFGPDSTGTEILRTVIGLAVIDSAPPKSLTYQGKLTNTSGQPVPDAPVSILFKFYSDQVAGFALWTSASISVTPKSGIFTAQIDDVPDNVFMGGNVWMEVTVGTDTLSPRIKVNSVPFAFRANAVGY